MLRQLQNLSTHVRLSFIVWGTILCGLLALGVPIFILTVWSDTQWVKDSLMNTLQDALGGPLHMETLNLNLFPSPEVQVTGLSFQAENRNSLALHINHLQIAIGWQSLWEKKLSITRALLDQPELTLRIPLITESEEPGTFPFPAIQEMAIHNGQLHLFHVSEGENPSTLELADIDLTITDTGTQGSTRFQLSAKDPKLQPPSTLTLNGTITLLEEHEDPLPHQDELAGLPGVEVQGQFNASQFQLGVLVQFLRGHALETPLHTKTSFQGNFTYNFQQDHDLLTFKRFQVSLDEWTFSGTGSIANVLHESPWLKVSGATQPIGIDKLPDLLPDDWMPVQFPAFLREHQIAGKVHLLRGTFSGPLDGKGSWEVTGELGLENGHFLPAPGQPLITNVAATVTYAPSLVQVSQLRGTIAPFTITAPEANLDFAGESIRLSIPTFQISEKDWHLIGTADFLRTQQESPTLTVSGSALPISLRHLGNILPEPWRPLSVHTMITERDIDGEIELLTGSVKWMGDETGTVLSEGVLRLDNGHVLVDPHQPPLTDVSGSVAFGSNLVRVLNAKARMASSKLQVNEATLEWKGSDIFIDLNGKGLFVAHDVHQALLRDPRSQFLVEPLSLYHDVQGNMYVSLRITGPLTHPSELHILDGDFLLEGVHLSHSADGLPLNEFTGHLSFTDKQIHIHRFNGILGNSPIAIKGQWSFLANSNALNLTMESTWSSVDIQTLLPSMTDSFSTFSGLIGTTLTLSGTDLHPDFQAEFDFTKLDLATKGLFQKPSGIPATVRVQGNIQEKKAIRLSKGEVEIPPYKLEAKGTLSWSDPPYIRGVLQTESGTGGMFPPGVIIGDKNLGLSSLAITWGLEGKDWDWSTWYMKGKMEATNRTSQSTSSKPNEETQSISLQWWQKDKTGKGEMTLKDIPIESLLVPQDDGPSPLTGTASLVTSLQMNLGSPKLILRSLTGKGHAALRQGLMQTGPVLSKIMGILNVPSLLMGKVNLLEEGLPYDQLEGSFSIENGLLSSQDLALKSPVLKLTAAGSYDLPTENLAGMVAVSPFGAYSNLLKDVPLFGSLMKGERKGLMTALFEVKGLRTDPDITYLPLESFTGGLKGLAQFAVDVLTNVVTLPIPDKENPNSDRSAK